MKKKYKISITYDGTEYSGWQVQPNAKTIQSEIQSAFEIILKEKINITASGRTDAGVHALCQVAHFTSENLIDIKKTISSVNGVLPRDIRVIDMENAEDSFHARYSAKGKIYHYFITTGPIQSPFDKKYCFHFMEKFNLPLIEEAARSFIGTHDFTSFANDHLKGSAANKPIKTLNKVNIKKLNKNKFVFEFEGTGFLYKMVRNIVGTLLDISTNKIEIKNLPEIFKAKDRKAAGRAAPAFALFLVKVIY